MNKIVDFYEAEKLGIDLIGGKGLNLAIMTSNGINVPKGVILISSLYKEFLRINEIEDFIKKKIECINDENIEDILKEIQNSIINAEFSQKMELEIKDFFNSIENPVHLAVRSSATAEDLEDASFAGQQETFLNISSYENLIYSIKRCFASLWGRRAFEYRRIKKYNQMDVSIAVVIQKMVNADVSGVMFTSNPISGKEEILIDASYGLGEAIVSGQVSPDSYILDLHGNLQNYTLGSKDIKIVYSEDGIKKINTENSERERKCLNNTDLKELFEQSNKIKTLYGVPMDIEWAKEKSEIHILQARKITTIENKSKKIDVFYKFGKKEKKYLNNMIEHFPILWYPLDDDVAMILQNMKYDLFKEVGIYIKNPLKMNSFGIIDVEKMKIKFGKKIFKYPFVYKKYKDNEKNIKYSTDKLKQIRENVDLFKKNICLYNETTKIETISETMDKLIELHKKISYIRFRYLLFPSVILGEKLEKIIKKLDKKYVEYDLLCNLDYITVSINENLNQLSNKIKLNSNLVSCLERGISIEEIKKNYYKEYNFLKEFLENYGWKSNYCCIPFSSESWNENPRRLIELLLLNNSEFRIQKNKESKYNLIINDIKINFKEKHKDELLKNIEFYRIYHVLRESSQYLWETIFGLLRLSVKEISLKLNIKYEELLFLKMDELKELTKTKSLEKFTSIINARKSKRRDAVKKWDNIIMSAFAKEKSDKFVGISGSNGKVKGEVCIIKKHSEFKKLKKDNILICPYTDPEWTPLFKIAKAVVADTGGALSHAAIVAREYGIPAVLGVGNATMNLKDGDLVIVDGEKGIVEKIV